MENTLYYGDNLDILSSPKYIPDESVDLIYLDPPFNSARDYNVLFRDESGRDSDAQIVGEPEDVAGARTLAQQDRFQFQYWALSKLRGARPDFEQDKRLL
jgi:DNA modification methylase